MLPGRSIVAAQLPIIAANTANPAAILANSPSYTFSAAAIGDAPAAGQTRRVIVPIGLFGGVDRAATATVTIGGVAATVHARSEGHVSSYLGVLIASALVPSGTTADVVVTPGGGNADGCAISVFTIQNEASSAPHAILQVANGSPASGTIDVPSGGVLIACSGNVNTGAGTWNAGNPNTETVDVDLNTVDNFAAGFEIYPSTQTGITVSRDTNTTGIAAVSWR